MVRKEVLASVEGSVRAFFATYQTYERVSLGLAGRGSQSP
jgi:hypothetical protein